MKLEFANSHVTQEAVHVQMERLVIVIDHRDQRVDRDLRLELFVDFALERFFGRLARLDLAAGKLPTTHVVAIAPLRGEYAVALLDDGRNHVNRFHVPPVR